MAHQYEYGLLAAGAVSASLIGRLKAAPKTLGPIVGVSFRVASRIANTLPSGTAVRSVDQLETARAVLFHAPTDQVQPLLQLVAASPLSWTGRPLVVIDCDEARKVAAFFRSRGASVALLRQCGVPGRLVVEAAPSGLTLVHRLVSELGMKPIDVLPGSEDRFEAVLTLAGAAMTPLIDRVAEVLRTCGLRDTDAVRVAATLFEQTARDYAHSGKLSWAWHIREPDTERLLAQIEALDEPLQSLLRVLINLGLEGFDKHPIVAEMVAEKTAVKAKGAASGG